MGYIRTLDWLSWTLFLGCLFLVVLGMLGGLFLLLGVLILGDIRGPKTRSGAKMRLKRLVPLLPGVSN